MIEITSDEKKTVLTDLLKRVQIVLNENKIKYYMAYGSLIGTVRHRGFIPWDDDIDLVVPRVDYIRLIHYLENNASLIESLNMEILEYNNEKKSYHKRFKIADTRTTMNEFGCERSAVFIDVFPLDFFKHYYTRHLWRKIVLCLDNILVLCHSESTNRKGIKGILYGVMLSICKTIGFSRMEMFVERFLIKITRYRENGFACSSEAGYGEREFCMASCYASSVDMRFENLMVNCPVGYDMILTNIYGDYMVLPPEEKRYAHDQYVMYWK